MSKAVIFLEDGFYQEGNLIGASGKTVGEVVFNTSMTGYQEIITDPSYKGQIVCMTYPLIGNYGVNSKDTESDKVQVEGFIIKEKSQVYSNWQAEKSLDEYLKENNITGIEGVDTRAITRHIRLKGSMKGIISSVEFKKEKLQQELEKHPSIVGRDLVKEVVGDNKYTWTEGNWNKDIDTQKEKKDKKVTVIDCGVKHSILRNLKNYFGQVEVFPVHSELEKILGSEPQGILFSNGPGDPGGVIKAVDLAKKIIEKIKNGELRVGLMGICLGHQILGLALGGKTYKLKFGHHGGNHPVKDLETGKIDITAQNHNFCVDIDSLPKEMESTHINLYDNTSEGMRHKELPIFCVQFHPEAGPGPFDARHIFGRFRKIVDSVK